MHGDGSSASLLKAAFKLEAVFLYVLDRGIFLHNIEMMLIEFK